jgi:chromosome segregation ATPase
MEQAQWTKKGATLSHKNACKEFGISEDRIVEALREGKLQYRVNYAHGNPYYRVLRDEVEAFAEELHGGRGLEIQKTKHRLETVEKEIRSLERRLASLKKEKRELTEELEKAQ